MKTLDPAVPEALEFLLTEINSSLSAYPNWIWIFNIHHHKPPVLHSPSLCFFCDSGDVPVFSLT